MLKSIVKQVVEQVTCSYTRPMMFNEETFEYGIRSFCKVK